MGLGEARAKMPQATHAARSQLLVGWDLFRQNANDEFKPPCIPVPISMLPVKNEDYSYICGNTQHHKATLRCQNQHLLRHIIMSHIHVRGEAHGRLVFFVPF
jgi:hypothetical protein